MKPMLRMFAALVIGVGLIASQSAWTEEKPAQKTKRAWTLEEAQATLSLQPHDPYLQYIVLQLAQRENKQEEAAKSIDELLGMRRNRNDRRVRPDLLGIFTGAVAVQESLQLDTMRQDNHPRSKPVISEPQPKKPVTTGATIPEQKLFIVTEMVIPVTVAKKIPYTIVKTVPVTIEKDGVKQTECKTVEETAVHEVKVTTDNTVSVVVPLFPLACVSSALLNASTSGPILSMTTLTSMIHYQPVEVGKLTGPKIKSHPWQKMLAGRKPEVSALARYVPDDFYFAEFRSLNKLVHTLEISDLWSTHLYNQAVQEARSLGTGDRLQEQLAIRTSNLMQQFYDQVVEGVAVTGSDLYLREGSDVTLIFQLKQPNLFKVRMHSFLKEFEKKYPDAKTSDGEHLGIPYVHVGTIDRNVHVFSAYPRPNLHVRSNSLPALRRILEAIQGKDADGKLVRRLGDTDEFAYIRTLLPLGAKEEDGLIYLSDPFIRRQVGPRVKLTEFRRLQCYNHLQMIGHASMMYRTEFGHAPSSLEELVKTKCAPASFGEALLACPEGGNYSLSVDGNFGVCSHHGHAHFLKPCCETTLATVSRVEADLYADFLKEYNEYWRTYFDPIAIRIQVSPERYRLETIVLPLIDNSIYSSLAKLLGGKPEPLDSLLVPKRNIFSVNFRLDKKALQKEVEKLFKSESDEGDEKKVVSQSFAKELKKMGVPENQARKFTLKSFRKFMDDGLGNQMGLHIYDAEPHVEFNFPRFAGDMVPLLNRQGGTDIVLGFGLFLLSSANSPAYFSIPIQDTAIVDDFIDGLDAVSAALTRRNNQDIDPIGGFGTDFYRIVHPSKVVIRGNGIRFGPVTWRFFAARIGKVYYIATKQYIIEDLIEADSTKEAKPDLGPVAHAMIRVRPENWHRTLPDYRLGWSENNRQSCLCNLAPLSHVGRAFGTTIDNREAYAEAEAERRGRDICELAHRQYSARFFCPDGGHYLLDREGRKVTCSMHGSVLQPRQHALESDQADLNKILRGFSGMTVTFSFLEDGLRAVLTIDKQK